jgi:hypothetical protein
VEHQGALSERLAMFHVEHPSPPARAQETP